MRVRFTIDGIEYQTPASWAEITLDRYVRCLTTHAQDKPEVLKRLHQKMLDEDFEFGQKDWDSLPVTDRAAILDFYAQELAYWSDAPLSTIREHMDVNELIAAYATLCDALDPDKCEVDEKFCAFWHENILYHLPKKHMVGATLSEYVDASMFDDKAKQLEGGNWEALPEVLAVLCRPDRSEKYDYIETQHMARAKAFGSLKMDVAINCSFFLLRQSATSKANLSIYSLYMAVGEVKSLPTS